MGKRRGPRAARGEVRDHLLRAARARFWSHDYGAVTMREIADDAGVDAALINYYFGSKANLFRESMSLPGDPVELVLALFSADRATLGYRTLLIAMEIWETSGMTTTVKVLIRSLLGSDQTLDEYRQWLDTVIITPAARLLGGKNAKYRIESGLAHILGLMLVRYMTQAEPIASMPREELARLHAPTVQVLFTGTYGR
ncbi:MAG: TetR/AcrR family transcriptional regulator [Flaviflexus sp.]|uniref:TetR/AcrR family transcriptional regulator n=1 Tax=Flaviflexus sp. TaxID=1969482 RepID=UPI003F910D1F